MFKTSSTVWLQRYPNANANRPQREELGIRFGHALAFCSILLVFALLQSISDASTMKLFVEQSEAFKRMLKRTLMPPAKFVLT